MPRIAGHQFTRVRNLDLHSGGGTLPGLLALHRGSVDPSLGANDGDFLYNLNGNLIYEAAGVTTTLGAVGGVGTTWESLYSNDAAWALTGAFTITQSSNNAFTLTKTGVGAGDVFVINNAGTGDDFSVATTRADATGIVLDFHHNSGTPADADVIFEMQINGEDDGSTKTEYGRIRFLSDDVTNATEDATFQLALFVAGTQSTCLAVTGPTVTVGDGTSNATITTSGALDLILSTNAGTDSGTIRIYDAANGNIELLNNGSGDVTIPTSGIVQGGTTATRCTFATAGTTGDSFLIETATITSGDVLAVNHSSAATLSGGNLLNLLVASSSVFSVGESGDTTIAGSAGNTVFTITAGDVVLSDASVAVTDADNAATFSVTNNTVTSATCITFAGSGVFTGTTTTSFFTVLHTGGTAGTTAYFSSSTATSSVAVVDISAAALTSGSALRITPGSATFTTGGKCIELVGGSAVAGNYLTATTSGAYTGTGMVLLTAGAATTGILLSLVSTTGMTSGSLLRMTTSTAGAVATNGICSIRATGAYTSTSNAGLLDVQASALVGTGTIVNIMATNGSQLTNTALNVEQTTTGAGYTGDFVRIVGTSTTGDCNLIAVTTASTSAGDGLSITGNGLVAGTSTLVNLVHGTSVLGAGNSMLRITSTGIDTGTTTGTLLDLAATAATSATLVLLTSATLDSGIGISMVLNGLTTGEGFFISHTTSVIADGGSLMRLSSTSVDTGGATNGTVLDLIGSGQLAGVCVLETFAALTTGTAHRIVANAVSTGILLDLETSAAGFTGNYIRCYDGAANDFTVGLYGATIIAGNAALTASLTLTTGDFLMSDGVFRGAVTAGVTADVGSVQGGSPITRSFVEISICANAGDAVTLPAAAAGQMVIITNHGANAADVFPASGDAINEAAVDTATSIAVNETFLCYAYNADNWEVTQLARNS